MSNEALWSYKKKKYDMENEIRKKEKNINRPKKSLKLLPRLKFWHLWLL